MSAGGPGDRYEPLPGLLALPAHLVRKLGPRGRKALAVAALIVICVAAVAAVKLAPVIEDAKRDNADRDRREAAATLAATRRRLIAEQRPRTRAVAGAPLTGSTERRQAVRALEAAIRADARRRVSAGRLSPPPPKYATCERVRYTPDAIGDPARRFGSFSCTAVTSELPRGAVSTGGVIGHPFRARVDFQAGRYTWCKVSLRPGEGGFVRRALVPVPRACTG